jgi:hypothetical protein
MGLCDEMAFNADFWVTIGTATPVIALSCILLVNDQSSVILVERTISKQIRIERVRRTVRRTAWYSYLANGLNLTIQSVLFAAALGALATRKDFLPEQIAGVVEASGIILLFYSTIWIVVSKATLNRNKNRLRASKETTNELHSLRRAKLSNFEQSYARRLPTRSLASHVPERGGNRRHRPAPGRQRNRP